MKKTMFIFISIILVTVLTAVFPANLVVARLASSPEIEIGTPAQQEEALVEDILYELNLAKGMSDDDSIHSQIDNIIDMVRKLKWLELTNQTEDALRLKYIIAESLERLINELPLASTGMTTSLAAMPESNPVYEELVRVRAKIERLIVMETPSAEITPLQPAIPELQRTERYIVYSAKFLCGPAFGGEGVQRGSYSTAINVHNPHEGTVYLFKKAVIANREDEPRGRISPFHRVALGPDEAIEIDCIDIGVLLGAGQEETDVTTSSQQTQSTLNTPSISSANIVPVSSLVRFVKGFVVIYSSAPLDVVGVYTASTPVGFSLDVEYLSPSTTATIPHTEQSRCPAGCLCLTKQEAEESGYTALCGGEVKICGYDETGNAMYCFEKPGTIRCPEGCVCLNPSKAEELGYPRCPQETRSCGYDDEGNALYCYLKSTGDECPEGCDCLSEVEAKRLGYNLCNDQQIFCGHDSDQSRMFCYEEPSEKECPQGCDCLTEVEAKRLGYDLCMGQKVLCGHDAAGSAKYCYDEPAGKECPQGCVCLTPAVAKRLGYDMCNNQQTICGYDTAGNALYCYEEPADDEVECPRGCDCLTEAEAKRLGYELCFGQKVLCGYNAMGIAMYCYQEPSEEQECPRGCICLTDVEAKRMGYVLCGNERILCEDIPGMPQKWCYQPAR